MRRWEEALVSGGIVEGESALDMLKMSEQDLQGFWIRIAIAYIKENRMEEALSILEGLVDE